MITTPEEDSDEKEENLSYLSSRARNHAGRQETKLFSQSTDERPTSHRDATLRKVHGHQPVVDAVDTRIELTGSAEGKLMETTGNTDEKTTPKSLDMGVFTNVLDSDDVGKRAVVTKGSSILGVSESKTSLGSLNFQGTKSQPFSWKKVAIFQKIKIWHEKYVLHWILGRREILRTKDGRHIDLNASRGNPLIDERTGKHFINNSIRSSRYTLWTFLPCQIWFQFSKVANLYFLITGIIQLIPGLSTTGTYTTILPLLFFLCFTILREGYDDFRRYRLDKVENRRTARVLYGYMPGGVEGQEKRSTSVVLSGISRVLSILRSRTRSDNRGFQSKESTNDTPPNHQPSPWGTVIWIDIKVGDIIELKRNDPVPADIILLYADGRNGVAYVETMALDGETNLKSKQPPNLLQCATPSEISNCKAHFVIEDPNLDLYDFNGKLTLHETTLPLNLNNVIYRGSVLRNTGHAFGMVVNTGEECKIRMNSNKNPQSKAPVMQKMTNIIVILLALFVVLLATGCTAGYEIWTRIFENHAWYLAGAHLPPQDIYIAFAIEFNNLIPLALYVSLEIIKLAQFLLLRDIEMYDEESNTPMVSNTQNIYENLGQISYIFSDKTGTLTENVMRFRKMSVAGKIWIHDVKSATRRNSGGATAENSNTPLNSPSALRNMELNGQIASTRSSLALPSTLRRAQSTPSVVMWNSEPTQYTLDILKCLQDNPHSATGKQIRLFLLSLAICHSCYPETREGGSIGFQAASPDELALVEAAQELGFILIDRTTQSITILTDCETEARETWEILDVIEFSSKRKRMSIVVRGPDNIICIFCKGADSVLWPMIKLPYMALQKESRTASRYLKSIGPEAVETIVRKSNETERRSGNFLRPSLNLTRTQSSEKSTIFGRRSMSIIEPRHTHNENLLRLPSHEKGPPRSPRASTSAFRPSLGLRSKSSLSAQNDLVSEANEKAAIAFDNCHTHIDEFASEGLRTLVYGYRFIDNTEYTSWKEIYHEAETSLENRQEKLEAAAETLEQNLNLAGATGIEDKLQKGVPETIEKLQQANIKIWMLTGDKRETAINIAHSAHLCKPYSHVIVLHHGNGDAEDQIASALFEVTEGEVSHSVLVIDGQLLVEVENSESLANVFYDLVLHVDSVICCRASPSQKASMVKMIRQKIPGSVTLAIGDGGNDIAMIQEAHVGVGISGKEGLQAARVADFSIAQFRFLQRLLLVHGHWNYHRTAAYILNTFWKEMLFYSIQVLYQKWNGYTGTSFYESWSLTAWNVLFTSLPVIIPGIFEQNLSAETLLAVPELYSYGQQNLGFNMRKYCWTSLLAVVEAIVIYFIVYQLYGMVPITRDQSLFAIGDLAFSVCVISINIKLLILKYHYQTWIPIFSCLITIAGWWAWSLFLSAAYSNNPGPYNVFHAFTEQFGKNPTWWAVLIVVTTCVIGIEVVVETAKRWWWPSEVEKWQAREGMIKRKKVCEFSVHEVVAGGVSGDGRE